jgi:hypothetical protein
MLGENHSPIRQNRASATGYLCIFSSLNAMLIKLQITLLTLANQNCLTRMIQTYTFLSVALLRLWTRFMQQSYLS